MAADDDDAKGDPDDGADLGGRSERVDESHSSYKQRMLRQRIQQALAEAEVAKQQLASYRAYQQRELDEVRQATAELNRLQFPESRHVGSLLNRLNQQGCFDDCRPGLRTTQI